MLENSSTNAVSFAHGYGHPIRNLRVKSRPLRPPSCNGSTSTSSVGRGGHQWAKNEKGEPPAEMQSRAVAAAPDLRNATTGGATFDMGGGVNAEGLVAEMQQPSNTRSAMRNTAIDFTPSEHQQLKSLATQCNVQEGADAKRTLEMTSARTSRSLAKAHQCNHERERAENRRKNNFLQLQPRKLGAVLLK
jgi:hypothetical protein